MCDNNDLGIRLLVYIGIVVFFSLVFIVFSYISIGNAEVSDYLDYNKRLVAIADVDSSVLKDYLIFHAKCIRYEFIYSKKISKDIRRVNFEITYTDSSNMIDFAYGLYDKRRIPSITEEQATVLINKCFEDSIYVQPVIIKSRKMFIDVKKFDGKWVIDKVPQELTDIYYSNVYQNLKD